jgi:hypothetical protein
MVELEDRFHPGRMYWIERNARQGETVDIPREEDIARGEELHAFVTEEDIEAAEAAADAEAEESEEMRQSQLEAQAKPTDTEEVEEVSSVSEMSDEELIDWIKKDKPNAHEVVDAAEGDPDLARRLLDAEDAATGGDSRKSVVSGLTAVIQQG